MSHSPPVASNRGQAFEHKACLYLQQHGLKLLQRNYRSRLGEIDLIMMDGEYLVFIEVRYRRSHRFGTGAESVDRRKQGRLISTANHYLQRQRCSNTQAARFDVISISPQPTTTMDSQADHILWIKDAFQA